MTVIGVKSRRVQVDEIWSFTAAKQKKVGANAGRGRHMDVDRYRCQLQADRDVARWWALGSMVDMGLGRVKTR